MELCSDILYQELSRHIMVKCSGSSCNRLSLKAPIFYDGQSPYMDNMIYVGRTGELPEPPDTVSCLIVSVGGDLPKHWEPKRCCLFTVSSGTDILSVFNILQQTFLQYTAWSDKLWQLLDTAADYSEMIHMTAALLDRRVTLINKNLEAVATSIPSGTLPLDFVQVFANFHQNNMTYREPFYFNEGTIGAYCINIFIQNDYIGNLSIQANDPPLTAGEKLIFEYFSQFVIKAVTRAVHSNSGRLVTMRSFFSDLLNCYPVNEAKLQRLLESSGTINELWVCAALDTSEVMRSIPLEYLCTQLETRFNPSYAVPFSPYMALFFPVQGMDAGTEARYPKMEMVFHDIDLYAGISVPFDNLMQARSFYRQAVIALQTAAEHGLKRRVTYFHEIAMSYALKNSTGELRPEQLIPSNLLRLRDNMKYWNTLKIYLDNEMNASQTARDLYVHRATLLRRLEYLQGILDMSTPEKRFYLRYCIYLYETNEE